MSWLPADVLGLVDQHRGRVSRRQLLALGCTGTTIDGGCEERRSP